MDRVNQAVAASERLAVIVPVLRDGEALAQLIADLKAQSRIPDAIIVVSGARDEHVATIARSQELCLIETPASRGLQLDAGARAADADILWFIHADARIPHDACATIIAAVRDGAAGGCLRFTLQGARSFRKRLLEHLVRLRIGVGGMAYGDQALFCTHDAYTASGGFPHWPLFEEVPLVRFLQKQRRFAALSIPVFVASRRWERDGWLRRSVHNRWLALRHTLGTSADTLENSYAGRGARRKTKNIRPDAAQPRG